MSRFLNIAIVLATIAVVATPVVHDQFRDEVARWYLASAANRVATGLDIQPQLKQAERWGDDLSSLRDYWWLRAEQALADSPDKLASVIEQAVARDKTNVDIGIKFARRLSNNSLFHEATAVLEATCIDELRQQPGILNELAYYRSLSARELDRALKDINQALQDEPDAAELRDTRGWVLFQMGKPHEAIDDADYAVKAFDGLGPSGMVEETLFWLEQRLAGPPEPRAADDVLSRREAGELLWGRGAVHYHRAKILEALGREEEAQAEFNWLRERKLPTDERVF